MSLLTLLTRKPPAPAPVLRTKTAVTTLVKRAPNYQRHDLAWWQEWLRAQW